jgi:signal transduction histidine kinase/ligand-binding sensor domain-containing protein
MLKKTKSPRLLLVVVSRLLDSAALRFLGYFLSLTAWSLAAAEPAPAPFQYLDNEYLVQTWQTEQGLPDNFINAIAQTPDGYIWVATFNGLARFNGVEFVVFDAANTPQLPSSRITWLHVDSAGQLWIGSESGNLSCWSEGRFKSFTEADGLPKGGGLVREDTSGEIWFSPDWDITNYFHLVNGKFQQVNTPETFVQRLGNHYDALGRGWGIESNFLFCCDASAPTKVEIPDFRIGGGWRLAGAGDGGIWVIAKRIQKFLNGQWTDFGPIPIPTDQFTAQMVDRRGNLWVGTGDGESWRVGTNGIFTRFKLQGATTSELGRSLFEDAEGNIWYGTGGSGLLRLIPRALRTYDARDGLASDVVRSVTGDGAGNMWLATVNRVDWFTNGNSRQAHDRGLKIQLPWNTYSSRDGSIWIGTYGEGLWHCSGNDGAWFTESGRGQDRGPQLNVIFEDRRGELQLGTPDGLYHVKGQSLAKCDRPPGLGAMDIRSICEDSMGELYLGLNGEGLLKKDENGWQRFTTKEGLADDHVWALWVDANNAVWVGTHGRGLSRYKAGHFFNFNEGPAATALAADLPRIISCIVQDNSGRLWLGSNQGLFRADYCQLNEIADGSEHPASITHYDRADGMGSGQCTGDRQPTAWKAKDGKLWFATMKGATVVDPGLLSFNTRPPPVAIESVFIDDSPQAFSTTSQKADSISAMANEVKVPPGSHQLEFRYAGLSFRAPDRVRFQYRLEGFDKDWVKARNRRVAYYTKVPPGSYHFRVIAANDDNVWNDIGASIGVVVMPQFWQTAWFRVAAIFAAAGLALGIYELRILQLKRLKSMQETFSRRLIESQENERKRMAAELHDSLGQSLLVVKNYAAMALKESVNPEKMRERLQNISATTSDSIEEVRSIARALRPYQLDRFGLTKTLEDAADLIAKTGSLEINTQIENVDGIFSPEAEISIFRAVQEWLSNVVKHAQASVALLRVQREANSVHLILEDDGIGFDYASVMARRPDETGFGLTNLRERVRLLGGTLKIDSAPGKGTRLLVEIPHEKSHNHSNS